MNADTIYMLKSPDLLERVVAALEGQKFEVYAFESYYFIFPLAQ